MTPERWEEWQRDWRWMEALATGRGWIVTPLRIDPPASPIAIAALEAKHGLKMPPQLRELLTRYSARVQFGWQIPSHMGPMEPIRVRSFGGMRDVVWDIAHIDRYAIGNFQGWRRQLADKDISEEPNWPQMWENQFPIADLANGDMLTIDVTLPDGPHPVRYFSHELEGMHGRAIAPDFITFVSEYSKLGCSGDTHDDWMFYREQLDDNRHYISARSPGAKRWLDWLERHPGEIGPDEPPLVIMARTPADHALLVAAAQNSISGVTAALATGATIDCVVEGNWDDEFVTAVTYAIRSDNFPMLELLVRRGANLNSRRLAMTGAVQHASAEMVDWLIAHGARVNGWKHERHWPVHVLVERRPRSKTAPGGAEAVGIILEAILKAGADPDAPWDNGLTMLMRGGVKSAEILLAHGADPKRRDRNGQTALHHAQEAAKVRLLVAHGADINALSTPSPASYFGPVTPLQRSLQWGRLLGGRSSPRPDDLVPTLLELGADPKRPDGSGRNALWYCHTVDDFKLMLGYGLDPKARDNLGNTLLHQAVTGVRIAHPNAIAHFKFLLDLGLDINATNNAGQTILHVLAAHDVPRAEDVRLAIESGADRQIKDARGRRPYDVTPKSKTDVLAVLQ